jgi:predicted nucleic acid-binding protein
VRQLEAKGRTTRGLEDGASPRCRLPSLKWSQTHGSVLEALDLEDRYQISFWDALIVQAAEASGATVLYSEDLSDG